MAPNLKSNDYYEILGLSKTANDAAIKKAYKKLAVKWHPDKNPGDEQATKNFQKISEAYATLSDEKKRKLYDTYGKEAADQSDQMPDDVPVGGGYGPQHGGGGGFPAGGTSFHFGGDGRRGGMGQSMSPDEAQFLFSQFFGGSDPFSNLDGGMGGRRVGGSGIRINTTGHPGMNGPFGSSFGGMMGSGMGDGMGMGGHPFGDVTNLGQSSFKKSNSNKRKRYDAIPAGTIISLKGLVSRPEKNGMRGEVLDYDPQTGRYVVQIEDRDEIMKVKPLNILQHVQVKLHGLESRKDLNGQKATILAWDESKGRYNVYVTGISKAMSLKPSNVVFDSGTVGQINGLKSKTELNGQWATIRSFSPISGRYDVQLSSDKILKLKSEDRKSVV